MTHQFSYDVFLSHSYKDTEIVRPFAERLERDGLKVWFDEVSVTRDQDRSRRTAEALEQSRVLVLCMSVNTIGEEWEVLESQTFPFRDPMNKERKFISLLLDQSPIRDSVSRFEIIKWSHNKSSQYLRLLKACRYREPRSTEPASRNTPLSIKHLPIEMVQASALSPDGNLALTSSIFDPEHTVNIWDLKTGQYLRSLRPHEKLVTSLAFSGNGKLVMSGSSDTTVRIWNVESGRVLRVLKGSLQEIQSVAWSQNQRYAVTGSHDHLVRVWNVKTGECLRVLKGHSGRFGSVAFNRNASRVVSGSQDRDVRLWDVSTGSCLRVFEGHSSFVSSVAWTADEHIILSASYDQTIRLWDVRTGRCLRILEGHRSAVQCLDLSRDRIHLLSGSDDKTIRLWNIKTGNCVCIFEGQYGIDSVAWAHANQQAVSIDKGGALCWWDMSALIETTEIIRTGDVRTVPEQIQYTNAKVVIVGESGAGKTGLAERLSQDTFTPSYSTSGTWSTQWSMHDLPIIPGWEREIWLWDFGGQADQRLIHQLYIDRAALVLLIFNSDRDAVLPGLREWQQALLRSVPQHTETFLVAGRTDTGLRFDREKVQQFAAQNRYKFFETSAQSGRGCAGLRKAIQEHIRWDLLERRTSPVIFKILKDKIIELRDLGNSLLTFKELREMLRQRIDAEIEFTDDDLETVVGLLDGPGMVKELNFGSYILLRPEWINIYAQAVIRTLKSSHSKLGCLPIQSIAAGELIFQTTQANGKVIEEKRLAQHEEPIVLQAMEQVLVERKLCLRQEGQMVFPSYYGLEQPSGPMPTKYFISYTFGGFLDDIYATLIVRIAYCGAFRLDQLWRDAADFETLAQEKKMGVKLVRKEDGSGELLVHFQKGVAPQEQVIFATYIHDHLRERASEVTRLRFYICPHCDTPVKNREVAMQRLEEHGEKAKIICVDCEKYISLWDDLERRFASESVLDKVALLRVQEDQELDSRRKGKLLALEVMARITSANQKCFEIPGVEDEGLDIEVEFTDKDGRGTGKRIYLQLKAGNSYLQTRKRDGAQIFKIKKQRWVKYWLKQECPVLLVIGTFPEDPDEVGGGSKVRFAEIRWMEISDVLRRETRNGAQPVRQIVFEGKRLDTLSVRSWREQALSVLQ